MNWWCALVNRRLASPSSHSKSTSHEYLSRKQKRSASFNGFTIHNGVKQTSKCHLYCHGIVKFPSFRSHCFCCSGPVVFAPFSLVFFSSFFFSLCHNIIYHIYFHPQSMPSNGWIRNSGILYFVFCVLCIVFSIVPHKLPSAILSWAKARIQSWCVNYIYECIQSCERIGARFCTSLSIILKWMSRTRSQSIDSRHRHTHTHKAPHAH